VAPAMTDGSSADRPRLHVVSHPSLQEREADGRLPPLLPHQGVRLVGRTRELGMLRERLEAALAGQGGLVLIGGEAGIGKSTLADALLVDAREHGASVLVGRCYDLSDTPPYGPWIELLTRSRGAELPPPPPVLTGASNVDGFTGQITLFDQVRDYFASASERGPIVVVLDDLQWADAASNDLLRSLARSVAALPMLLVGVYRSDELPPDHPLSRLLPLLEREAGATHLRVQPLGPEAMRALVDARFRLPESDADRLVQDLRNRSEGNAFFAVQLMRSLEEEGVLRPTEEGWSLGDLRRAQVPPLVRQVIESRLARLDDDVRRVLALAAVLGQLVPFDFWTRVAGDAEDTLIAAVEAAIARGLVEATDDGLGFRFSHALVREAIYEGIMPLRRRGHHRLVAEALLQADAPDPNAVGYHLRQAGDPRAVEWLVTTGERAERTDAWATAAARYRMAADLLDASGDQTGEVGWLRLRVAFLIRYIEPHDAIPQVEAALAEGRRTDDRRLAARALSLRGTLRCYDARDQQGLTDLREGVREIDALASTPSTHVSLETDMEFLTGRGHLVIMLAFCGYFAEALAEGERYYRPTVEAAAFPRVAPHPGVRYALGFSYAMLGRVAEAERAYGRALAELQVLRTEQRGLDPHLWYANVLRDQFAWFLLRYRTDDLAERNRVAADFELLDSRGDAARAVDAGLDSFRWISLPLFVTSGKWREARQIALSGGVGKMVHITDFLSSVVAELARLQGEPELAWRLIRETWPAGPASEPGTRSVYYTMPLQRLAVDLALDARDFPTARAWLTLHDRWFAWMGAVLGLAEGKLLWARFHRLAGETKEAEDQANAALALANAPRQPSALVRAYRALGEIATDDGRFDDAKRFLDQSHALARSCQIPFEEALTILSQAELSAVTGRAGDAFRLLEDVWRICGPLGAKPTLTRAEAVAAIATSPDARLTQLGLSARELEVLRLLAQGHSNQEIADALSLSMRTVERHLSNAYGKIGAPSRSAAVAYVLRHLS
jgi:DNA-binding CsgD family transcriptional regulator